MNNKSFIFISIILFIACGSSKPRFAAVEELHQYKGPYYLTITFTPKNIHPMTMGGIGGTLSLEFLRKNNLDDFIESFYEQMTYTPILMSAGYWRILECSGLNKAKDRVKWHNNFYLNYLTSDLIEENKLILKDGNHIVIRKYKFFKDLDVKYVEDFKGCVISSSIELDINKIKTIDKVAILLDKED